MVTHLAVIPDGNRRWARARGLSIRDGHEAGIRQMGLIARSAFTAGVETFTFWWGSPANLRRRDRQEVAGIVEVLNAWLSTEGARMVAELNCRFHVLGQWEVHAPGIRVGVEKCQAAQGTGTKQLCLLMAYDGREEILDAAQGGADGFEDRLWTSVLPPVDLVLRSGGEPHLSAGFLLWQIADAQLAFTDLLWPEVTPDVLTGLLQALPERRFGA